MDLNRGFKIFARSKVCNWLRAGLRAAEQRLSDSCRTRGMRLRASQPRGLPFSLALARLIHWRCRQMRLAAGPACIRRVSPRAHTSSTLQRTRARAAACIHACAGRCLHAQRRIRTQHLSHTSHLCAHAHMHMHTARQTASHTQTGYHRKNTPRHTHAHRCTLVRAHSCLHTHIHT